MGFAVLPTHIVRDPSIPVAAKGLLLVLSSYASNDGKSWPSLATLANNLGQSPRQVQRQLRRLEQGNWIKVMRRVATTGANQSSLYVLNFDRWDGDQRELTDVSGEGDKSDTGRGTDLSGDGDTSVGGMVTPVSPNQDHMIKTNQQPDLIPPAKKKKFKVPEAEEVAAFFSISGSTKVEADKFFDYYESKGWTVGKSPMKSWKAAARNWMRNAKTNGYSSYAPPKRSADPTRNRCRPEPPPPGDEEVSKGIEQLLEQWDAWTPEQRQEQLAKKAWRNAFLPIIEKHRKVS